MSYENSYASNGLNQVVSGDDNEIPSYAQYVLLIGNNHDYTGGIFFHFYCSSHSAIHRLYLMVNSAWMTILF